TGIVGIEVKECFGQEIVQLDPPFVDMADEDLSNPVSKNLLGHPACILPGPMKLTSFMLQIIGELFLRQYERRCNVGSVSSNAMDARDVHRVLSSRHANRRALFR